MNNDDSGFMRVALELAAEAEEAGEVPVGAVVVRNGVILGRGYNCPISAADPTAHAEVMALRNAAKNVGNYRLADCTLYVTLEPCAMCIGAIVLARIPRLVFGATDPKAGACGSIMNIPLEPRLNHRVEVVAGLCAEDSQQLLQEFFRQLRKNAIRPENA